MLTLPIPLPDPCRNVAPAIAPPTVRQDCDQHQANESRLPLRVILDWVEPTTGAAMSAMLRITPRGPSLSVPRTTIFKSASGNGLCSALASSHGALHTCIPPASSGSPRHRLRTDRARPIVRLKVVRRFYAEI